MKKEKAQKLFNNMINNVSKETLEQMHVIADILSGAKENMREKQNSHHENCVLKQELDKFLNKK